MFELLVTVVVVGFVGLFYWVGYRDSQIEDKYKRFDDKGDKWVP